MRILLFAYAFSGLISLGYQVFWLRHFVDRFGSSTFTFVLVISSFILGLGLGALASRGFVKSLQRVFPRATELALYGVIELAIAASVLLVFVEALLPPDLLGPFPYIDRGDIYEPRLALQLLRLPLATACVLVPCFFMGTTFPLLCRTFLDRPRLPAALYAWNTLGACLAVLLCEFVLLRRWGTDATLWILFLVNVALGVAFLLGGGQLREYCARDASTIGHARAGAPSSPAAALHPKVILFGAILSGFLSGALEADAFRRIHFAQVYNGSAMAFVSFWAIAAIFVSSWVVHRVTTLRLGHLKLAFAAAFVVYVVITRTALLPANRWLAQLAPSAPGRFAWDPEGQLTMLMAIFVTVGAIVFPCYACVSLLLPWLCNDAQRQRRHLGVLYGVNTLAFLAGMVVFSWIAPAVNMFYAFWLCTFAFAAVVLMLYFLDRTPGVRRLGTFATLAALGVAVFAAPRTFDHLLFPNDHGLRHVNVRALRGSPGFTSFVAETAQGDAVFLDTGQMSNTSLASRRYMKLMVHFPLLAQEHPERALLICFGVGNTGSALGKHTTLREIDVVDLSRNILETAPEFAFFNDAIYEDPRVRRIHDDGRSFLSVTDRQYDLVTSEPPPPLMDGISRLYSAEYYADVLDHLTPRGCMSQWLPIYQMPPEAGRLIVSTFVQSFPHTLLLTGCDQELLLVGSKSAFDLACIARRFAELPAVVGDLNNIQVPSVAGLLGRIMCTGAALSKEFGHLPVITDQKNLLSSYWPTEAALPFPYDPGAVLAELSPELLDSQPELRAAVLDPRKLRRAVPDFPAASLAAGPYGASTDWLAIESMNKSAEALLGQGAVEAAFQAYDRSLALLPEQLNVLLTRAWFLAGRQPAQAIPWFRRCVELFPEFQDGHFGLAVALGRTGDIAGALASATAALAVNPRFYDAHIFMAQLLEREHRPEEAREHATAAQQIKPKGRVPSGSGAAQSR